MTSSLPPILVLHCFDAYAGAQRIGHDLVTSLRRGGADVCVRLGFGGRGFLSELRDVRPDVQCDHIPTRKFLYPLWSMGAAIPIAWAAARGRIVWVNAVYAVLPAMLAILLFPRRVVVHLHEAVFPRPFHWLLHLARQRGTTIVCVSADQAQRIGTKAIVLPNPVRQPATDLPSRQDRLLFVGTTQPAKGLGLFVDVAGRLEGSGLRMAAYLSDEDRQDNTLVATAREAGIEINFGERSYDAMYRDGFLLLMATDPRLWVETFSLVSAEAVAALVPVIGAGSTVLPEVLGDALAFDDPSRDPATIANGVRRLLDDPQRYDRLRQACAERRPHFSVTMFGERVVRLLQELKD